MNWQSSSVVHGWKDLLRSGNDGVVTRWQRRNNQPCLCMVTVSQARASNTSTDARSRPDPETAIPRDENRPIHQLLLPTLINALPEEHFLCAALHSQTTRDLYQRSQSKCIESTLASPWFSGGGGDEGWPKQLIDGRFLSLGMVVSGSGLLLTSDDVLLALACNPATIHRLAYIVCAYLTPSKKNKLGTIRTTIPSSDKIMKLY